MKVELNGKTAYIDGILKQNLDDMKREIKKDSDVVLVIDGKERIGKSVMAQLVGWYLSDGKLELDQVCLEPKEFTQRVKRAKQYEVVIFDECFLGLAAEDWQGKYNKMLKKMLVTVGQKNLILILVLPSVFDISKYVALHRSDGLIHCFKSKGERGFFAFYNDDRMKKLYILGKKMYSYYQPKSNFYGRFTKFYGVDETKYREKKGKSLNDFLTIDDEERVGERLAQHYRAIGLCKRFLGKSTDELAKLIDCSVNTIRRGSKFYENELLTNTKNHKDSTT